ncbi:HAD-IIB family hydrolase [Microbulbifer sp. SA54]|uniref:HAD-IIB family hydrolase n=1 Tax=Microbulbifer sp. SA54 TaxID=3401577 RepID=UPI003AAF1D4B
MPHKTNQQVPQREPWLIVTDLDGTLLDHFTYSHTAAEPALKLLEEKGIPLILNSSKTRDEMQELRRSLNNHHPFIVENGSAIFIPVGYFPQKPQHAREESGYWILEPGTPRASLLDFLERDQQQHPRTYLNFHAASTEEIVAATGLSGAEAEQAQARDYSEPLLWQGNEQQKAAFVARANAAGFTTLQGGRFLHLLGQTDKGVATRLLKKTYQHFSDQTYRLIASGDGPNDLDMLKVADIAILVRSPAHPPPPLAHPQLIVTRALGPFGWGQAIQGVLSPETQQIHTGGSNP